LKWFIISQVKICIPDNQQYINNYRLTFLTTFYCFSIAYSIFQQWLITVNVDILIIKPACIYVDIFRPAFDKINF